MTDWIHIEKSPHIKKEREKAVKLKKTNWWRNEINRGICHYCRKKFCPKQLTMDHIVPVARGGKSVKGNVVPCCKECNNKKKYLIPAEIILEELEKKL